MTETGLVSIIIPLYNGEKYIAETIESAISQSYAPIEVIVVDDGSRDNGPLIARRYPVQLISQENRGISGARNTGIRALRGEFIALLDQDDLFKPHKIEKQVRFFQENPETILVYTPEERFGSHEEGCRISVRHKSRKISGDIFTDIYKSNYITPGSTLIRRAAFDVAGLFDESLSICEDHDLFIRMAYHGCIGFMEEPLLRYRWHGENTSTVWSSRLPFIELTLYKKYLPCLKEKTTLWWWVYNKQCGKALRDMGINTLQAQDPVEARKYLLFSFFRMPWRFKTIKHLAVALVSH